jgi:hypothetical protein
MEMFGQSLVHSCAFCIGCAVPLQTKISGKAWRSTVGMESKNPLGGAPPHKDREQETCGKGLLIELRYFMKIDALLTCPFGNLPKTFTSYLQKVIEFNQNQSTWILTLFCKKRLTGS